MKIIAIAFKDITRSVRSLFLIGMTLAAPLLITLLIYFAFGSLNGGGTVSMAPIKIGVVNADLLPADSQLEVPLGQNVHDMFFDDSVSSWILASDFADETAVRAAINAQKIGVAVIIPQTFTRDALAGDSKTPIVILQDPTLSIGPGVVKEMVTSLLEGVQGGGVAYKIITARMEAHGKTLDPLNIPALMQTYSSWYADFQRALFHAPEKAVLVVTPPGAAADKAGNGLQSLMGLVMAGQLIFFSFFTGAYAMMSILQEAEEGTLARLFSTPTNRTIILLGKFLAVFLTVFLQGGVLLLAGRLLFGIQWGQAGSVAIALFGQMLASVGLAVLLVAFIKTSKQAGPVFGGALTGLGMLSGLFTTNISMPESFKSIANFTPQGWVLKAWTLSLTGQPANEMIVPFLVLATMGLVMFSIGALMFRRRFA
jgi:ABC-2 type transport system permease protein